MKEHEAETQQRIANLEAVFKQLGEQPESTACSATEGLKKEHESLHEDKPSPDVMQMSIFGGAVKTEHDEIAGCTALVQSKGLGENEAAQLLQENLAQEKAVERRVEAIAKRLGKDAKQPAA